MPVPTPESGESHDDFLGRCMGELEGEFPDAAQRQAVCEREWAGKERAMNEPKQLKGLAVEIKDAAKGEIEAVFATFNAIDHDGDWTEPGAFSDGAAVRISAYNHGSWPGFAGSELPIGKGVIKTTPTDARLVGRFFLSTSHGQAAWETIKEMAELQEWSYGFDVLERGEVTDEQRTRGIRRVLRKLKVHEVSPVFLGAGVATRTIAAKSNRPGEDDQMTMRAAALVELARFERTRARLYPR